MYFTFSTSCFDAIGILLGRSILGTLGVFLKLMMAEANVFAAKKLLICVLLRYKLPFLSFSFWATILKNVSIDEYPSD